MSSKQKNKIKRRKYKRHHSPNRKRYRNSRSGISVSSLKKGKNRKTKASVTKTKRRGSGGTKKAKPKKGLVPNDNIIKIKRDKNKIDLSAIREFEEAKHPSLDFDIQYTFHYDETNNIRKFYTKESGFNADVTKPFVLGGIVYEGDAPDINSFFDGLKLQSNINDVKLKHIAKGGLLECLTSDKLKYLLQYLLHSDLYVHYTSINLLYWSIVDIVDSAILASESASSLGEGFARFLKDNLYQICKLEIDSIIELFHTYKYPNLKKEDISDFIDDLISIFCDYIQEYQYHLGLESLRQMLKQAKKKNSLPFIENEEDHVLIKNLLSAYLRNIFIFKKSKHIYDKEDSIIEILDKSTLQDGEEELTNHEFLDSSSSRFIQLSDIVAGLLGKFFEYVNTTSPEKIIIDFSALSENQKENIDLLIKIIDKSDAKNPSFLLTLDSDSEIDKVRMIRELRQMN